MIATRRNTIGFTLLGAIGLATLGCGAVLDIVSKVASRAEEVAEWVGKIDDFMRSTTFIDEVLPDEVQGALDKAREVVETARKAAALAKQGKPGMSEHEALKLLAEAYKLLLSETKKYGVRPRGEGLLGASASGDVLEVPSAEEFEE